MPINKKLLSALEKARTPFEQVSHKVVYTAYDTAQTLRVKLTDVVKPLLVKIDKGWALVLLSAGQNLNPQKIAKLLNVKKIRIPSEKEIVSALKLKKKEGLAAFGSLYRIPVILEKKLAKAPRGFFPTGSFTDSIRMKLKDFIKLESPTVGVFGVAKKFQTSKTKKK